ncbi:MAG: hypothetical protein ABI372_08725 [Ginsengibacter sp.]
MQDFKNKLYNHQTPPPPEIWNLIAGELQVSKHEDEKVISISRHKKSTFRFYGATAAASIIIIFLGSLLFNQNKKAKPTTKVTPKTTQILAQKIKDSISLNQKILESIIHNPKEKEEIISKNQTQRNHTKKYLTVANPEGQPVKISAKVATLIISADHGFPPKPVWNKKIYEWQKIMLGSTVLPTSANLVDLVKLAARNDKLE